MREQFIQKKFLAKSLELIECCNQIIERFSEQGYTLTLRQLYYQLIAKQPIPMENTYQSYSRVGSIVNKARLAGLIDWDLIEDRIRGVTLKSTWNDPLQILRAAHNSYREDLWIPQPMHVEVWVEKDALSMVVEKACEEYRVPYISCRGYMSQSIQYQAAKRFENMIEQGKDVCVLHLGDHDPSGIDMTRDNRDRLNLMSWNQSTRLEVRRIALNMDQIEELDPPPNPTKLSDSRAENYIIKYGHESWELDALEPSYIENLIKTNIDELVDHELWEEGLSREEPSRDKLQTIVDEFED